MSPTQSGEEAHHWLSQPVPAGSTHHRTQKFPASLLLMFVGENLVRWQSLATRGATCQAKTQGRRFCIAVKERGGERMLGDSIHCHTSLSQTILLAMSKCLCEVRAETEKPKCWDGVREESCCMVRNGT